MVELKINIKPFLPNVAYTQHFSLFINIFGMYMYKYLIQILYEFHIKSLLHLCNYGKKWVKFKQFKKNSKNQTLMQIS